MVIARIMCVRAQHDEVALVHFSLASLQLTLLVLKIILAI